MAAQGLFRQEAVEAQRREWLGSILVAAPLLRWLLTALALSLAAAIVLFLCFGHYTRRETVTGQLVTSAGLLNIAAPSVGTITRVHVHDGQTVKAGEVLLELSSEQDSATLKIRAELDRGKYPTGIKITDAELALLNLQPDKFHGEWNYTVLPSRKKT